MSSLTILVNDSRPVMLSRQRLETCLKVDAMSIAKKLAMTCAGTLGAAVSDIDDVGQTIFVISGKNREVYTFVDLAKEAFSDVDGFFFRFKDGLKVVVDMDPGKPASASGSALSPSEDDGACKKSKCRSYQTDVLPMVTIYLVFRTLRMTRTSWPL
jgi:hypothetical protein